MANRAKAGTLSPADVMLTTSVTVEHLHGIGRCRGVLTASQAGLTFTPEEKSGKHVFALQPAEFLPSLNAGTLTITSTNKTFRFRLADRQRDPGDLQRFMDHLSRRQRASP